MSDEEVGLSDEVLARIPLYPDQELHLRRRSLRQYPLVFLDWAQYNLQDNRYYLATPFRGDSPEIIDAMIEALQALRRTM